jgi:hypothetical protein
MTQIEPPTWNVEPIPIEHVSQFLGWYCAPACAQMLLSIMGYPNEPTGEWQFSLFESIVQNPSNSGLVFGSPDALAATITSPPPLPPANIPGPTPFPYNPIRKAAPDDACSAVATALVGLASPSAVFVRSGTHWVVIYGGDGHGDPQDPTTFSICNLRLCNPQNGAVNHIPGGGPVQNSPDFLDESITYPDFLKTYFTPAPATIFPDGKSYAVVCDQRAMPGGLGPQCVEPAPADGGSTDIRIDAVVAKFADVHIAETHRGRARLVRRLDGEAAYYLIPFIRPDGYANVLRLDQTGRYLGMAYASPYTDMYRDAAVTRMVLEAFPRFAYNGEHAVRTSSDLFWAPCFESTTPYNPFYRVSSGPKNAYVSLGGAVVEDLHHPASGKAFRALA